MAERRQSREHKTREPWRQRIRLVLEVFLIFSLGLLLGRMTLGFLASLIGQ
ncbi:hypothetical protein [Candidatus Rhodobacter oscarellae]|uniref:hypothetical protein n=1 Tax=Candidatus Rhodobacter oscarellae TaxID=1675527 RepID=UPI001364BD54|nr:hypothetical protein [Candidatus Rhodobacter lobularis]